MPVSLSRDQPPNDELGIPDENLDTCPDCGRQFPADSWHRCETNTIGDVPEEVR